MNVANVRSVPRPSRVKAYLAARVQPPSIDQTTVTGVLERYGLAACGHRRNLRLARRSSNVVLETNQGVKVLKRYRAQWSEPTVQCAHSIVLALEARGVPAVRLTRTPDGATWTVVDDHVYGVFDFLAGSNLSLMYLRRGDRLARFTATAARTLAGLHRALRDFVPEGHHHMGLTGPTGSHRRDIAWHEAALAELTERCGALAEPYRELVTHADRVRTRIAQLERSLAGADLTRLVIHGDYGLHNLLFRDAVTAIPVDFELARLDWRVYDLISVLGKHRFSNGDHDNEAMATFLTAYTDAFPLTPDEQHRLADAWSLYKLRAAVQYWRSYFETDGPVRKLESALDSIRQADVVPRCVASASAELGRGR